MNYQHYFHNKKERQNQFQIKTPIAVVICVCVCFVFIKAVIKCLFIIESSKWSYSLINNIDNFTIGRLFSFAAFIVSIQINFVPVFFITQFALGFGLFSCIANLASNALLSFYFVLQFLHLFAFLFALFLYGAYVSELNRVKYRVYVCTEYVLSFFPYSTQYPYWMPSLSHSLLFTFWVKTNDKTTVFYGNAQFITIIYTNDLPWKITNWNQRHKNLSCGRKKAKSHSFVWNAVMRPFCMTICFFLNRIFFFSFSLKNEQQQKMMIQKQQN